MSNTKNHYSVVSSLSHHMDRKSSELSTMNFAYSLFNKIRKVGYHQPDVVTFNTLLKGLCLNGDTNCYITLDIYA
ncbi:PPR repeat protein [Medicago truncatula]|uniref:PPR repeat protein n=1 Tax=Medicago truncatula TaxID=3880 RepID=A0A072VHN0_MEDTR|nr:PPR repeat protein [Medicago truncatula]